MFCPYSLQQQSFIRFKVEMANSVGPYEVAHYDPGVLFASNKTFISGALRANHYTSTVQLIIKGLTI